MSPRDNLFKILIIDYGSQFTQLIARRIRELGVFSEIYNINQINSEKNFDDIGGIILCGLFGFFMDSIKKWSYTKSIST